MLTNTTAILIIIALICFAILYYGLMITHKVKDHSKEINFFVKRYINDHLLFIGIPSKYIINDEKLKVLIKKELDSTNIGINRFSANVLEYPEINLEYKSFKEIYSFFYDNDLMNYKHYEKLNNKQVIFMILTVNDNVTDKVIKDFLISLGVTIMTSFIEIEGDNSPTI